MHFFFLQLFSSSVILDPGIGRAAMVLKILGRFLSVKVHLDIVFPWRFSGYCLGLRIQRRLCVKRRYCERARRGYYGLKYYISSAIGLGGSQSGTSTYILLTYVSCIVSFLSVR
ncbi:hypothetical protein EV426DRAFT_60081 [Tirmania nivea]|nr:hypothetical protein EV426DRAFT_60081 [Tirmania nivea]